MDVASPKYFMRVVVIVCMLVFFFNFTVLFRFSISILSILSSGREFQSGVPLLGIRIGNPSNSISTRLL